MPLAWKAAILAVVGYRFRRSESGAGVAREKTERLRGIKVAVLADTGVRETWVKVLRATTAKHVCRARTGFKTDAMMILESWAMVVNVVLIREDDELTFLGCLVR